MDRRMALDEFYARLDACAERGDGWRLLGTATGRDGWSTHGVYFIREPGELREDQQTPRVVRVGTHALSATSRSSLWQRLRTHRGRLGGSNPGGGNHRGSIFRLHVGTALVNRDGLSCPTWGVGSSAPREIRDAEGDLERLVSEHIGRMSVLNVPIVDRLERAVLERSSISMLSNHDREPIDPPSPVWLGQYADRVLVRSSGLWNVDHVESPMDLEGLPLLNP